VHSNTHSCQSRSYPPLQTHRCSRHLPIVPQSRSPSVVAQQQLLQRAQISRAHHCFHLPIVPQSRSPSVVAQQQLLQRAQISRAHLQDSRGFLRLHRPFGVVAAAGRYGSCYYHLQIVGSRLARCFRCACYRFSSCFFHRHRRHFRSCTCCCCCCQPLRGTAAARPL
jgi:hypothetical protein